MGVNGIMDDIHYAFDPLRLADFSKYKVDEEKLCESVKKNREVIEQVRKGQSDNGKL